MIIWFLQYSVVCKYKWIKYNPIIVVGSFHLTSSEAMNLMIKEELTIKYIIYNFSSCLLEQHEQFKTTATVVGFKYVVGLASWLLLSRRDSSLTKKSSGWFYILIHARLFFSYLLQK